MQSETIIAPGTETLSISNFYIKTSQEWQNDSDFRQNLVSLWQIIQHLRKINGLIISPIMEKLMKNNLGS